MNIYILGFLVGIITGCITFIFGSGLNVIVKSLELLFPYNLILLPLVAFLIVYFKDKYKAVDGSMHKVFIATRNQKYLDLIIIPYQILTTWLGHLAGASVGREGVAVQLGACVGSKASQYDKTVDKKMFILVGMAAGFAGLFGTPITASIFAIEVTKTKITNYNYVGAIVLASFIANFTSSALGLQHFGFEVSRVEIDARHIILFMFSMTLIFAAGTIFAWLLKRLKGIMPKLISNDYVRIIVFSIIGAILLMVIEDGRYMSLGTNIIDQSFNNPDLVLNYDWLLKILFTTYFISIGFQGGEVTPLFSIGASLGVVLARVFMLPTAILASCGYGMLFAHATNAYIASFVLILEVFGINIWPYAIIALVLSYLVKKETHSIYPLLEWE